MCLMNAVQWYSEIKPQFNYMNDFIGGLHSGELGIIVTGICKAYDRDIKSRHGIYLPHLFADLSYLFED